MKWEAFECDECGQRYALEQFPDNEIEEPICPACASQYSKPVEDIRFTKEEGDA